MPDSAEYVAVLRSDVERLSDYFDGECDLDHNGLCQAHTVSADCFVPRLWAALTNGPIAPEES